MDSDTEVLRRLYDRFNARDIDGVLAALADDVVWVNGMDGGHVCGRAAVRAYWTRQWALVRQHVAPVGFTAAADKSIVVVVKQVIRDLEGNPVLDPTHGLRDKTVGHVFRLRDGRVVWFDIRDEV